MAEMPTEPRPPLTEEERERASLELEHEEPPAEQTQNFVPDDWCQLLADKCIDERAWRRRAEVERDALAARVAELERVVRLACEWVVMDLDGEPECCYCGTLLEHHEQGCEACLLRYEMERMRPPTRIPGEPREDWVLPSEDEP